LLDQVQISQRLQPMDAKHRFYEVVNIGGQLVLTGYTDRKVQPEI
jgi:hypothetical protein